MENQSKPPPEGEREWFFCFPTLLVPGHRESLSFKDKACILEGLFLSVQTFITLTSTFSSNTRPDNLIERTSTFAPSSWSLVSNLGNHKAEGRLNLPGRASGYTKQGIGLLGLSDMRYDAHKDSALKTFHPGSKRVLKTFY